jgi:hypothetical protein
MPRARPPEGLRARSQKGRRVDRPRKASLRKCRRHRSHLGEISPRRRSASHRYADACAHDPGSYHVPHLYFRHNVDSKVHSVYVPAEHNEAIKDAERLTALPGGWRRDLRGQSHIVIALTRAREAVPPSQAATKEVLSAMRCHSPSRSSSAILTTSLRRPISQSHFCAGK